jgi:hypothetical protein
LITKIKPIVFFCTFEHLTTMEINIKKNKLKQSKFVRHNLIKAVLLLVSLFLFNSVKSQEIQILSIDSSQYPTIKLKIAFKGDKSLDSNQLKIELKGNNLPFSIFDKSGKSPQTKGRAIYYLVEGSGNTSGKMLRTLKKGITESLKNLHPNDIVNLGWFGSYELDSSNLKLLNRKFISDLTKFSDLISENIKSKKDSLCYSELNRNILSSFDYLLNQNKLPEKKLFIVLSVDRDKSLLRKINPSECIDISKINGIPIHSITYLDSDSSYKSGQIAEISAETGGENIVVYSQNDIENALRNLYDLSTLSIDEESQFDIEFKIIEDSSQSKSKIELSYNGNRQFLIIGNPNTVSLIPQDYKKYLWYSIAILGIIVMIMLLINLFSRKGKQVSDELESPIESDLSTTTEKKNSNTRPKSILTEEKIIAPIIAKPSGPSVLLSLQGRTTPFVITKNETTIGRHDTNDIPIPEQTVTGKHAKIVLENGALTLVDLGSTNGTFVNGVRIRSHELKSGDRFRLGNVEMTLK